MPDEKVAVHAQTLDTILDAVRARVASVSVLALLADDTDCYAKGSPGDAYAKNKCSIDLTGNEVVLPPFIRETFGPGAKE